jgi:hypothetical protein
VQKSIDRHNNHKHIRRTTVKKFILGLLLVINCELAVGSPKQEYLNILRKNMPIAIVDMKMFNILGGLQFIRFKLDVRLAHINNQMLNNLQALPECQENPDPCTNKFKEVETKRINTFAYSGVHYIESVCMDERLTMSYFNLCIAIAGTAFNLHNEGSKLESVKQMILQNTINTQK